MIQCTTFRFRFNVDVREEKSQKTTQRTKERSNQQQTLSSVERRALRVFLYIFSFVRFFSIIRVACCRLSFTIREVAVVNQSICAVRCVFFFVLLWFLLLPYFRSLSFSSFVLCLVYCRFYYALIQSLHFVMFIFLFTIFLLDFFYSSLRLIHFATRSSILLVCIMFYSLAIGSCLTLARSENIHQRRRQRRCIGRIVDKRCRHSNMDKNKKRNV